MWADGETDMMKLIVTFLNFSKAPKILYEQNYVCLNVKSIYLPLYFKWLISYKKLRFLRMEVKSVLQYSLCVVTPCCLTVGTNVPSNVAPEHGGNKSFPNVGNCPSLD